MEEQKGDSENRKFSYTNSKASKRQLSCYITYTNSEVHSILKEGFKDSPLYSGKIKGRGPRYCPSIEDKIVTFGHKDQHQLFLEPEGWETNEYYINGFSSSLPLDIQFKALKKIKGLEKVKIFRPGYAIEYDYFPPTQLDSSLESKLIQNLFFAGQINGTTGYEEAAAQGLMAGINAYKKLNGENSFILRRDEAYIGVLIDDLITKGIDEPYRMFTSRAEYRILLRQDNADMRLTPKAIELGTANRKRKEVFKRKAFIREELYKMLKFQSINPADINNYLLSIEEKEIQQKVKFADLLLRPKVFFKDLLPYIDSNEIIEYKKEYFFYDLLESVEIEHKYCGYIEREKLLAEKMVRLNDIKIDRNINFDNLKSISTEGRFKLNKYRPETIGQASRISGISPSDINVLLLYIGR